MRKPIFFLILSIISFVVTAFALIPLTIFAVWWNGIDQQLINQADDQNWDTSALLPHQIIMTPILDLGVAMVFFLLVLSTLGVVLSAIGMRKPSAQKPLLQTQAVEIPESTPGQRA